MQTFNIGDNAVYPGYGVVKVVAIETKEMLGTKTTFYNMQLVDTGLKIMIPTTNVKSAGLRAIISKAEAARVVGILKEKDIKIEVRLKDLYVLNNYIQSIQHLPGVIEIDALDSFKILSRRIGRIEKSNISFHT